MPVKVLDEICELIISKRGEIGELFIAELWKSSSLSRAESMKQSIVKVDEKSD